jgi:phosphoribosylformimino-5-aminoimidazole carboxamide ribotide isomerase
MQIIPAIDLIDGKVVRLTEGDYARKTEYVPSPLDMALLFEDAGLQRLHVVDLDGARKGTVVNWKVLEEITSRTSLLVDFGGGVKKEEDVIRILESGASWVTVGSIAVKSPELFIEWLEHFGPEKFFLGADVREGKIAVSGWQETSALEVHEFIDRYMAVGLDHIFCTDISKDGKLQGASVELYREIIDNHPGIRLVASGGVSSMKDLEHLRQAGCEGAIVGKAIYENKISIEELKAFHA